MARVLISDPISATGVQILENSGIEVVHLMEAKKVGFKKIIDQIDGIIVRSGTMVDKGLMNKAKNLQIIARAGVGIDNIDVSYATRKGIVVINTPDVNTISAAEHTIALLLALSRNIHIAHDKLINGQWGRHDLIGTELKNKIIGVIGLGKIGREVIKRCKSFGMKIIGYDPYVNGENFEKEEIEIIDLDSVIKSADYITLHIPLNDSTKNLFDHSNLSKMKPTARIINVARGGIINEADLAKVLNDSTIAGAAVDVFSNEPLEDSNPLLSAKNILLSPHLGASTSEAKEGVSKLICEQVRDYLNDGKLSNVLNMPVQNTQLFRELRYFLKLSEMIGSILSQLIDEPVLNVAVECQGTNEDMRPVLTSLLQGLLKPNLPDRINYINAEAIAKDLGILVELSYKNSDSNYQNIISACVKTKSRTYEISGSVFDNKNLRLINILGRDMEITPKGNMIFLCNVDVPGVIGKIGTLFGRIGINIAAYLLSRNKAKNEAFAVIRLERPLENGEILELKKLDDIKWFYQIKL